jgi:hypothetical protein
VVILPASSYFSGAVAGGKKDFCKGSFARTSFTLFLMTPVGSKWHDFTWPPIDDIFFYL